MRGLCVSTLLVAGAMVSACAQSAAPSVVLAGSSEAKDSGSGAAHALPAVVVYKNPSCGCCRGWVEHMQSAGFRVRVEDVNELAPIKKRVGVPANADSCHTAEVGGYFVEGHVPAEDVKRLLAQGPQAKGLVVPGMPMGSPGMASPGAPSQPYDVLLVAPDGSTTVFAHHSG